MKKNKFGQPAVCLLAACQPALLYIVWIGIMRATGHAVNIIPMISDELFWYHQVTGIVDHGAPLGYYGFNGSHAIWGTFAAWDPAMLLPYGLLGKIFGFGLSSMSYANVLFLSLAMGSFAYLTRLTWRDLPYTAAAYCALLLNLHYSYSAMAEPLRWAMAIVLSGCMIRIARGETGRVFRYVVCPLLVLYCSLAYLMHAMFIPVYLWLIMDGKKKRTALPVTIMGSVLTAGVLWKLDSMLISPYDVSTGKGAVSQKAVTGIAAVVAKLKYAVSVMRPFTPAGIWENRSASHGFVSLYAVMCLLVLLLLGVMIWRRRKSREVFGALLGIYVIAAAMGGYCFMYSNSFPYAWTFYRGLNASIACGVLLLSLYRSKMVTALLLACAVLTLPSFYHMSEDNFSKRELSEKQTALYETMEDEFAQLLDISPEHSAWENTIAQYGARKYGTASALALALPRSAGYNAIFNNSLVTPAGHAVVFHNFTEEGEDEAVMAMLAADGYEVVWEHKAMTVLSRR